MSAAVVPGSFRDPSGFVFTAEGALYRQVNKVFAEDFDACVSSGLYEELTGAGVLIPHRTVSPSLAATPDAHVVLQPERVDFISYPYEWCFGQLKDAALLTLEAQERALKRGFVLRDASAYNVQFVDGRPVFIDTLSFERYREGTPWVAYKQFCEHFLAPLMLMALRDVRLGQLLRTNLEGIPLDLCSELLPGRSWLSPSALLHVHLHARATKRYEHASVRSVAKARSISRGALTALLGGLRSAVESLDWRPAGTEWADYTDNTNYSDTALEAKKVLVREYLAQLGARTVWDVGGNTGLFSRVAREVAPLAICFDYDPAAVERNYRTVKERQERGLIPLLLNVMNPSAGNGWAGEERMSLEERGPADVVMALALVHHIAISNNVPLPRIADFFSRLGRTLIIEFVPKSDSQVQRLLTNRPDIFPDYTLEGFERAFATRFDVTERRRVGDSERWLYRMQNRLLPGK